MTTSMELFEQLHLSLANGYVCKDARGKNRPVHSISITTIIARQLLTENIQPTILGITNEACDSDDYPEWLIPKQYGGRVFFGGHIVCMVEDIVYDPILPYPVGMDEYPNEAFGANLEFEDITDLVNVGQTSRAPSTSRYLSADQITIRPEPQYL